MPWRRSLTTPATAVVPKKVLEDLHGQDGHRDCQNAANADSDETPNQY